MTERARDRAAAERRGRRAEALAEAFLRLKGYRILDRRYKTPVGEVDLIAARGDTLAFVEIKQRRAPDQLAEVLRPRQRQRIARAAQAWLARNPRWADRAIRFDLIFLGGAAPQHLQAAWRPDP